MLGFAIAHPNVRGDFEQSIYAAMTKLRLVCWFGGDIKRSLRVGIPKPELGNEK